MLREKHPRGTPDDRAPTRRRGACAAALVWVLLGASAGACDRNAAPAPSSSVDQLGRGELVEGKEVVAGFPLPDGMVITYRVGDSARAVGGASLEDVANYVRQRVNATPTVGPNETSFFGAVVKEPRGPSRGPLRIVVHREGDHTTLSVSPRLGSNYR